MLDTFKDFLYDFILVYWPNLPKPCFSSSIVIIRDAMKIHVLDMPSKAGFPCANVNIGCRNTGNHFLQATQQSIHIVQIPTKKIKV